MRRDATARRVIGVVALITLAAGIKSPLEPLFALDSLDAGATGLGTLGAVWGGGMMIGSLVASWADRRFGHATLLTGSIAVVAGAVMLASFSPVLAPVALLWLPAGIGNATGTVAYETLLQESTADAVRGRVMAALQAALQAGLLAGVAVAAATDLVFRGSDPARAGMLLSGVAFAAAALASWVLLGRRARVVDADLFPGRGHRAPPGPRRHRRHARRRRRSQRAPHRAAARLRRRRASACRARSSARGCHWTVRGCPALGVRATNTRGDQVARRLRERAARRRRGQLVPVAVRAARVTAAQTSATSSTGSTSQASPASASVSVASAPTKMRPIVAHRWVTTRSSVGSRGSGLRGAGPRSSGSSPSSEPDELAAGGGADLVGRQAGLDGAAQALRRRRRAGCRTASRWPTAPGRAGPACTAR